MARDWTTTLWAASFNGFPFYVERDAATMGRRLVPHEFPNSDTPYVEDVGRKVKSWPVTLYVASDIADAQMRALEAVLDAGGVGVLVLPMAGPLQARPGLFSRSAEKDRLGYVAFTGAFWEPGSNSPTPSVANLAQLAFDAIGSLATASSSLVSP